jgi:uncharacterized damage-inducible protein DinB
MTNDLIITTEELLAYWQGHRRLTRKVIEAFPEDKFETYSVGGMRPFSELALEMLDMAVPGVEGFLTDQWKDITELQHHIPGSHPGKEEVLRRWDEATATIDTLFPQIPAPRFRETTKTFGRYEDIVYNSLFYLIDNEVHHRAQGYVYLRSLGITPPPFWDRS